jgi:hypothetical protein
MEAKAANKIQAAPMISEATCHVREVWPRQQVEIGEWAPNQDSLHEMAVSNDDCRRMNDARITLGRAPLIRTKKSGSWSIAGRDALPGNDLSPTQQIVESKTRTVPQDQWNQPRSINAIA